MKEKEELIESFYGSYHQRVLDEPKGHGMDYVHAYMSIKKNKSVNKTPIQHDWPELGGMNSKAELT
jgi:hypothetical protein